MELRAGRRVAQAGARSRAVAPSARPARREGPHAAESTRRDSRSRLSSPETCARGDGLPVLALPLRAPPPAGHDAAGARPAASASGLGVSGGGRGQLRCGGLVRYRWGDDHSAREAAVVPLRRRHVQGGAGRGVLLDRARTPTAKRALRCPQSAAVLRRPVGPGGIALRRDVRRRHGSVRHDALWQGVAVRFRRVLPLAPAGGRRLLA